MKHTTETPQGFESTYALIVRSEERERGVTEGAAFLLFMLSVLFSIWQVVQRGRGINYGYNRVRFTRPVAVGSRIRLKQAFKAVEPAAQAVRMTIDCTIEIEHEPQPALVAESVLLIYEP